MTMNDDDFKQFYAKVKQDLFLKELDFDEFFLRSLPDFKFYYLSYILFLVSLHTAPQTLPCFK